MSEATRVDVDSPESDDWGLFVARAVQAIRSELGESAANRVAPLLREQKAGAIEALRDRLSVSNAMLEKTLADVAEARSAHERLQLDIARMQLAVHDGKQEVAEARSSAADVAAERKAALDEHASRRMAEIHAAEEELEELRAVVLAERAEADRFEEEAIARSDSESTDSAGNDSMIDDDGPSTGAVAVVDLRDRSDIDLRRRSLDERQAELDEWESDLIGRAHDLDLRAAALVPTLPPPGENVAGWGRQKS